MAFRLRYVSAIAGIVVLAIPLLADSIDDAAAKARGVPVQQIQLENEQKKTADLQAKLKAAQDANVALKKQVEELSAQVAQLKAALTPDATAKLDLQASIAAAIKEHKIIKGMTMNDMEKAFKGLPQTVTTKERTDSEGVEVYKIGFEEWADKNHTNYGGIMYHITFTNGRVTSWRTEPYTN